MVRELIHDPLHADEVLTKEHQAAIGCVAVESARLEQLITVLIWSVLAVEIPIGQRITDEFATVTGKLELLKDLFALNLAEDVNAEFRSIYEDITKVLPRRNTVIHGRWEPMYSLAEVASYGKIGMIPIRKERTRVRQQPRKSKSQRIEQASDVMNIAKEVHRCHSSLFDLVRKHAVLPDASPDKFG